MRERERERERESPEPSNRKANDSFTRTICFWIFAFVLAAISAADHLGSNLEDFLVRLSKLDVLTDKSIVSDKILAQKALESSGSTGFGQIVLPDSV